MKRKLLTITIFLSFSTLGFSQLSKEETKLWKTRMKELKVESYKKLVEDKEAADSKVIDLSNDNLLHLDKISALETTNSELLSDIEDYKRAAKESADKLTAQKTEQDSLNEATGTNNSTYGLYTRNTSKTALTYKVQIGAFKKFNITKYFNNHQNFSGDIDDDGSMKYTLGEFQDYWESDKFKQFLREMGVEGAWVVAYKDGKRINMKDAREGL